jgi:hypothetical protein
MYNTLSMYLYRQNIRLSAQCQDTPVLRTGVLFETYSRNNKQTN